MFAFAFLDMGHSLIFLICLLLHEKTLYFILFYFLGRFAKTIFPFQKEYLFNLVGNIRAVTHKIHQPAQKVIALAKVLCIG